MSRLPLLCLLAGCGSTPPIPDHPEPDSGHQLTLTTTGASIPGAPEEVCDGADNDGDGEIDEGFDADGDGVSDCLQCAVTSTAAVGSGESATACEPREPLGEEAWDFELLWDFTLDEENAYVGGCAFPVVADLSGDGVGDVICQAGVGGDPDEEDNNWEDSTHLLYALDGATGELLWVSHETKDYTPTVAADVDNDGRFEILAMSHNDQLVGLSHEGDWEFYGDSGIGLSSVYSFCFDSVDYCYFWDPISMVDLDRDGSWEVVTASAIMDASSGSVLSWLEHDFGEDAPYYYVDWLGGEINYADLDGDGTDEIIFANAAYDLSGKKLWSVETNLFLGMYQRVSSVVVEVDGDAGAEVVFLGYDGFWIVDGDGTTLHTISTEELSNEQYYLTNDGLACAGDLDGDGEMELALANHGNSKSETTISAWELDGTLMWSVESQVPDGVANCHVFDFNGDNSDEVMFNNYDATHVLDGRDGTTRMSFPTFFGDGGCGNTQLSTPLVVDLDGDGSVELIIGHYCDGEKVPSVEVYTHPDALWPTGGRIWPGMSWSGTGMTSDGQPQNDQPRYWHEPGRFRGQAQAHVTGIDVQPVLHDTCAAEAEVRLSVGAENLGPDDLTSKLTFQILSDDGTLLAEDAILTGLNAGSTTPSIEFILNPEDAAEGLQVLLSTQDADDCNLHNNAVNIPGF